MIDKNIHKINYKDKEIILVGTAHVSKDSADLVREAIDHYQPDNICIELDSDRLNALDNPDAWKETDLLQVIKDNKAMQLLANTILSAYQKRMADEMGSEVGLEMITAITIAREKNIPITNADRNVNITFKRIWRSLSLIDKFKLLIAFIGTIFEVSDDDAEELSEETIEEMLQEDVLTASLSEIRKELPTIAKILVDERDQYLAHSIKNASGKTILAVVGGAHVSGIKSEINKEQDIEEITFVPEKKPYTKIVGWLISLAIILLLASTFKNGFDQGLKAIINWALWSGGLAALATVVVNAHPLTTLATFVSAPLAALNPLIAVGFIAATVEATLRKPTVNDVDNINQDIKSFKGWRRNRFIKSLSLVFIANLGSVIGQIISGTSIIRNLF